MYNRTKQAKAIRKQLTDLTEELNGYNARPKLTLNDELRRVHVEDQIMILELEMEYIQAR